MQDRVPPFAYSKVKKIIEAELGKPLNKIFKSFNEKPISAASLGQVHKAVLKNGKVVVLQRPKRLVKQNQESGSTHLHRYWIPDHLTSNGLPIQSLLFHGVDFLVKEWIPGKSLDQVKLSNSEKRKVWNQVGLVLPKIHEIPT